MLELALHTGIEHPDLLWMAIPSFLTFLTGLVLGARSGKVRELFGSGTTESTN